MSEAGAVVYGALFGFFIHIAPIAIFFVWSKRRWEWMRGYRKSIWARLDVPVNKQRNPWLP
jgi:hypothetical protein